MGRERSHPKWKEGGRGKLQKRAMPLQTRLPRHLRRRPKRRRLQGKQQRRRRRRRKTRALYNPCCKSTIHSEHPSLVVCAFFLNKLSTEHPQRRCLVARGGSS